MKKILTLALIVALTASLFAGCGNAQKDAAGTAEQPTETSFADIQAKGEIIIGLDDTFAPMGFRDESGKLIGFDIDLAEAVADVLGVKAKFQPIDWNTKEMSLNTGKVDLLWNGLSITDERKEKMLLTDAYLNNKIVIMTAKDSTIKTIADLAGKNIGIQVDSAALEVVKENEIYSEIQDTITEYADYDLALTDLDIGRVDAVVIDDVMGKYKNNNLGEKFAFADEDFGPDEYGVGMKLGADSLYDAVSKALKDVKENGKAAEISEKWFGEDIVIR